MNTILCRRLRGGGAAAPALVCSSAGVGGVQVAGMLLACLIGIQLLRGPGVLSWFALT